MAILKLKDKKIPSTFIFGFAQKWCFGKSNQFSDSIIDE
jgi:hypothetical protein